MVLKVVVAAVVATTETGTETEAEVIVETIEALVEDGMSGMTLAVGEVAGEIVVLGLNGRNKFSKFYFTWP